MPAVLLHGVRVLRAVSAGQFIEYARVHSNLYGTSIAAVRSVGDAGKTCLLEIDVQGADQVKNTDLCARFVFIAPPSFDDLETRLRGRGTETEEKITLRLKNARDEMAYLEKKVRQTPSAATLQLCSSQALSPHAPPVVLAASLLLSRSLPQFGVRQGYWDTIIVNDSVDVAYAQLKQAVCLR